jgi:hypothetical protein
MAKQQNQFCNVVQARHLLKRIEAQASHLRSQIHRVEKFKLTATQEERLKALKAAQKRVYEQNDEIKDVMSSALSSARHDAEQGLLFLSPTEALKAVEKFEALQAKDLA